MTHHLQTNTMPRPAASPPSRRLRKRLPAGRRGLRLAAVAASLPLLLAVTASGGVVPAQAASNTGGLFAGHEAPGRGTAPAWLLFDEVSPVRRAGVGVGLPSGRGS